MRNRIKILLLSFLTVVSFMATAGCEEIYRELPQYLYYPVEEGPSGSQADRGWGRVDVEGINDYIQGVTCHYSDGIIVGLGERFDQISLRRYGRRIPVIIASTTGDGNLADLFYFQYYGVAGNKDLHSLYFDGCLYLHSGGSMYDIRANEIVYLDPAFGTPTYTQTNHTVSDLTSFDLIEMHDSAGFTTVGIQLHDFRLFRGMYNAIHEKFKWIEHEGPVQFEDLGISMKGDNEKCLIIDGSNFETRFYIYCAATDMWIHVKTRPGIGYPEDWSISAEESSHYEKECCMGQYNQPGL